MSYYKVQNPITYEFNYFDTEDEANAQLALNKTAFLEQESYRFNIAKEIVNGNNTIWSAADLDNDPEDGLYKVFNHTIGQYEDVQGLSVAKERNKQLKDELFASCGFNKFEIVEKIPPTTGGILGANDGSIPVEVM